MLYTYSETKDFLEQEVFSSLTELACSPEVCDNPLLKVACCTATILAWTKIEKLTSLLLTTLFKDPVKNPPFKGVIIRGVNQVGNLENYASSEDPNLPPPVFLLNFNPEETDESGNAVLNVMPNSSKLPLSLVCHYRNIGDKKWKPCLISTFGQLASALNEAEKNRVRYESLARLTNLRLSAGQAVQEDIDFLWEGIDEDI